MDMTALPSGPWDNPIPDYIKSRKMVVLIHDLEKEIIEHEFIVDYGNYEHRKFLGKLTYYAITNNRSIESLSIEEWDRMK